MPKDIAALPKEPLRSAFDTPEAYDKALKDYKKALEEHKEAFKNYEKELEDYKAAFKDYEKNIEKRFELRRALDHGRAAIPPRPQEIAAPPKQPLRRDYKTQEDFEKADEDFEKADKDYVEAVRAFFKSSPSEETQQLAAVLDWLAKEGSPEEMWGFSRLHLRYQRKMSRPAIDYMIKQRIGANANMHDAKDKPITIDKLRRTYKKLCQAVRDRLVVKSDTC